jgi:cyclic beta-1,2-glucan synthetase
MLQLSLQRLVPEAPAMLCQILERKGEPLEPPIRSEIFGPQRFAQHGISLGLTHRTIGTQPESESFTPQLRSNIARLRAAYQYIGTQANAGYDVSPAAEWLLENFHLLEAQFKEVFEGMPPGFFRALPVLVDAPLAGLPRIYGVAWAFVAHTDGAFDDDLLVHFLSAYQQSCELNLSELWALPTTLRVVLMENMRRLAERVAINKAARELANLCSDRIANYDLSALDDILDILQRRGVGRIFLAQMVQRVQDLRVSAHTMYQEWLQERLPDFAGIQIQIGADQAADNLSVSSAVTSLRTIGDTDWTDVVERTSVLMRVMLGSDIFRAEHAITRDGTLHAVEKLARRGKRSEVDVARGLLQLIEQPLDSASPLRVPLYWLAGKGRALLLQRLGMQETWLQRLRSAIPFSPLTLYLGAVLMLTLPLVWLALPGGNSLLRLSGSAAWLGWIGAAVIAFPASEAALALVNRIVSEAAAPAHLPRLSLVDGIASTQQVMVIIPSMLVSPASASALTHQLELHYLANPEEHAQFGLLTDWADADTSSTPMDAPLLDAAREHIDALNRRYPRTSGSASTNPGIVSSPGTGSDTTTAPPRFLLLHRARRWSKTEGRWIGWERKRGKLELLLKALATGDATDFQLPASGTGIAPDTRYLLTLDSDTQLPPGRLRELVSVASHPCNVPVLDAGGQRVVAGYGILQPRIATPLPSTRDFSRYHWLFAGQVGVDPYNAASSEVYQDLFGEGSFSGKGLMDVQAVHQVLHQRLPEGVVLSHDLLEGALARCGTVTEISLIEDTPFHADVAAARLHRWTRGDWQLLPLLLAPQRFAIGAVNRWKMIDNLRRSLVAPISMLVVLASLWGVLLTLQSALLLVFSAYAMGPLIGALTGCIPSRSNLAWQLFLHRTGLGLVRAVGGGLWNLAQLAQHAAQSLDAIARALYRTCFSHRHLLEWTTAAASSAAAHTQLPLLLRQKAAGLGVLVAIGVALAGWSAHPVAGPLLCLLWCGSPVWTWWVSRPIAEVRSNALQGTQLDYLDGVARDTWRFFERCISADDRHLPPDNLQTLPADMLAHRTSPTNIGLYLLSTACARESGWIGDEDLCTRLEATLTTLQGLQRHGGHFLNWYDTQTGAALWPMYVSTVDSGNLSAHLLCVSQACLAFATGSRSAATCATALERARRRMAPLLARRKALGTQQRTELRWQLADHRNTRRSHARDAARELAHGCASDSLLGSSMQERLGNLATRLQTLALEPDYRFLYNRKRALFHIGYRVAEQQLDASFYDLLASEARLTSLVAIAKGDAPVSHWSSLGRLFLARGNRAGLRSWSGSMFEYMMPSLVLDEPFGSVLFEANCLSLTEQMAYAQAQQIPWGISESAYAARDFTLAYQYAPQGVPRLALRRTPLEELVVAPYATALASLVNPLAACINLQLLEKLGARQRYGFVEALDYSPARQITGQPFTLVETFMAHHQGMTIAALANVLHDGVVRRWGMANTGLEAIASLMQERGPREVSRLYQPPPDLPTQMLRTRQPGLLRQIQPGELAIEPTQLLSNGRYSVSLRANGAGTSTLRSASLYRVRDDALRDACGNFFYITHDTEPDPSGDATQTIHSITSHPAPDPQASYEAEFHADRVMLDAKWPALMTRMTVWVSPEDDIELRQVEVRNCTDLELDIELMSTMEVALSEPRSDESHPAFSNMFVSCHWHPQNQALVFERKPRTDAEQGMLSANFVAQADSAMQGIRICTDRLRWSGRNAQPGRPLLNTVALVPPPGDASSGGICDTGLDPVAVIAVRLRIPAQGRSRVTFATAAAREHQALHACMDKYRQASHIERSSLMSATLAGIRLRSQRITTDNFSAIQTLSSALLLNLTRPQRSGRGSRDAAAGGPASAANDGHCDRRLLWRFGISGDRPILLVKVGVLQGMGMLRSLGQALRSWAWAGVACDAVIVNTEPTSYQMQLQNDVNALLEAVNRDCSTEGNGTRLHVLRSDELTTETLQTLQTLARVRLHADGRPLSHHTRAWSEQHANARLEREKLAPTLVGLAARYPVPAQVSSGTFVAPDSAFRFEVREGIRPQRPWSNVLANPEFGTLLTESGGGYTWGANSRLNQLTAWSNDPVADPPGEWLLLQEVRTGRTWSLCPNAWGDPDASYTITHGQGWTTMAHQRGHLQVLATWCVDAATSVRQVRVELTNAGHHSYPVRVVGLMEWVMGASRADRASTHTSVMQQTTGTARSAGRLTVLSCTQRALEAGFGGGTAFLALARGPATADPVHASFDSLDPDLPEDWTCDRRELFDTSGRLVLPDTLAQVCGEGLDPCAALSTHVALAPGETRSVTFLVGFGPTQALAHDLAVRSSGVAPLQRLRDVHAQWDQVLGACVVQTPDPLFDAMVNRWLLYQTVSCRLWAKAAFYQAGGATGFRDQLQDAMALAWSRPDLLRAQIVLCASRQFEAGDVQHWWHQPLGVGVRTHFSDDLLWLSHAITHYLASTGDVALLDQQVNFLEGQQIPEGAEDAYFAPTISAVRASVFEHAARAIDRSLRTGVHGLPLMGTGDWNDGMNRVGFQGRGESVWLAWFLCGIVGHFAPLARSRGEPERAACWEAAASGWRAALVKDGWDGAWFRRAFFDNGEALGTSANAECAVDLMAQTWSVLSDAAPRALQEMAMNAIEDRLVDHRLGLIRLLDPPLQLASPSAGYIQCYPLGVRENGGQYAHGGVWALIAQATAYQRGMASASGQRTRNDLAYDYFTDLSPAHRASHPVQGPLYGLEPFAMAGDVYAHAPYAGRGGWSWYTGAAGMLHRGAIEAIFGLEQRADSLRFLPTLPSHWDQAEMTLRRGTLTLHFILVRVPAGTAGATATRWNAQALDVGQWLQWPLQASHSRYVMALPGIRGDAAQIA